ncbi:MAG: hypothetical protein GY765_32230 [bacterium]|nr:hypothetical protein [bacterium]
MTKNNTANVIQKRTEDSGKVYTFKEEHNPRIPAGYWFQEPVEGPALFIVFYTQACRWAKCLGCNLPSQVSQYEVPFNDIMKQIDYIFDFILSMAQKDQLKKIIISNNGSVLDEETFSTTALLYFVAKMNLSCPNVSVLTMETRPEYVDLEELEVLDRALKEGNIPTQLELAVGFEAFDDKIRNEYFLKGLELSVFETMVEKIAKYGFNLKAYFMQKPVPGISEEEAIADVVKGIDYLSRISEKYKIGINMHLNPTFVSTGTPLETEFLAGNFTPPLLDNVREAALTAENKKVSIFVGLNDEGLSVPGGTFIREGDEELVEKFNQFNRTQDFSYLK